jgi:hypothetical protein
MNTNDTITVKELIHILQTMPQDLPVLVSGYENGYEHFNQPKIIKVIHCPENMYYDGEYQTPDERDNAKRIQAVILERKLRDD